MTTFSHSIPERQTAQTDLIEYVYALLPARAHKLAWMIRDIYGAALDADDLVQVGIEYALRGLDKAFQADNPMGYLLTTAQHAMARYCREQRGSIRVPQTSQQRGAAVPVVLSLDAPLDGCEDLTLLDLIPAGG